MADDPTEEEDLTLEAQEAGLAFRAEMWATDTLLGYWPYLLGTIVVGLASVLVWSKYDEYVVDQQHAAASAIALLEVDLPSPVGQLAALEASGQALDTASLTSTAQAFEAVDITGAARVEALLKAAELYRLSDDADAQRRALEGVVAEGIEPFAFLAGSTLANLDLEAGDNAAAVARLQGLMEQHADYLGEQAAIDLGMIHEHLDQNAEARTVYQQFEQKWPDSPRLDQVTKRLEALNAG